jgi:hypothetical protein
MYTIMFLIYYRTCETIWNESNEYRLSKTTSKTL